jgi:hypothetical protein
MPLTTLIAFAIWIGLSVAIGHRAGFRGRNAWGWLALSLLISPLLAGIFLFLLPPLTEAAGQDPRWQNLRSTPLLPPAPSPEVIQARRRMYGPRRHS